MDKAMDTHPEEMRLAEDASRKRNWKRWGPYLAERQWGTVREDYSDDGSAWEYFSHNQARSRAYRWGEDGLLGICDRECRLCFALALWNGKDPILKERLFGLTNSEGNHGEDVKELYSYLDSTPTHSYMKALYRYPYERFPYEELIIESRRRGIGQPEYELADTGVFDGMRYFDVVAEYAKAAPDDILIQITIHNRGKEKRSLSVIPTLWFRNTWIWGCRHEGCTLKPMIKTDGDGRLLARHESLREFFLYYENDGAAGKPELLFTENETNTVKLYGSPTYTRYVKDAFHEYLIGGNKDAVNPKCVGTKVGVHHLLSVPGGESVVLRLRLTSDDNQSSPLDSGFDQIMAARAAEADSFYRVKARQGLDASQREVFRHASAGLLWSKQFYHMVVEDWMRGDPSMPPPSESRKQVRNSDWPHMFCRDVMSMPDKWEYPWFAAWDLAFHMIPMARIDPDFAKRQLLLLMREWYMHPNGQIPAYEYNFNDVNPPVHAWACWRVYKIAAAGGSRDRGFLASAFQKLLINFTWWVNRKDAQGRHIFSGGFLGLDNIGVFDRSKPLPGGGRLEQADATAWMAFYAGTMLAIALELAVDDPVYEDMASKFFEHFISIADAMNSLGGTGLWHEEDGFYYDQLIQDGRSIPLRIRSMVGLIPLIAVEAIHADTLARLRGFHRRTRWFIDNRKDLASRISFMEGDGAGMHLLLAIPSRDRLEKVLRLLFDENEFLSPFGLRSLSKRHAAEPYVFTTGGVENKVDYVSGESNTFLFGGNSNWRGPIWFPVNYLILEALERYHHFYGDAFKVEFPTGSGKLLNLKEISLELHRRLASLFLPDANGRRPYHGNDSRFESDPHWRDVVSFHEYFDGETGRGLGASHQTGWTALVACGVSKLAFLGGGAS